MKKLTLSAVALLMPLLSSVAYAEKLGFVNTERLLREAPLSVKARKDLEKEFSPREQELQKMAKQVRDMQAQLDKDGVTMSESDRKNKERELANLNREFLKQSREFREELNMQRNAKLAVIQERARKAILDIAKAEKFDLIVEQAVYFNPKIDITDRVMKSLGDK